MSVTSEYQGVDLTERLDRMESLEEIRRLAHNYAHAFDKRDLDQFLSLWTDDAVWSAGPGHEARGHDAIAETTQAMWGDIPASHHWSTNSVIDVDGAHASAVTDVQAVAQGADGGWTQTAATYRDTFSRVNGRWRFASRHTDIHEALQIVGPSGNQ